MRHRGAPHARGPARAVPVGASTGTVLAAEAWNPRHCPMRRFWFVVASLCVIAVSAYGGYAFQQQRARLQMPQRLPPAQRLAPTEYGTWIARSAPPRSLAAAAPAPSRWRADG